MTLTTKRGPAAPLMTLALALLGACSEAVVLVGEVTTPRAPAPPPPGPPPAPIDRDAAGLADVSPAPAADAGPPQTLLCDDPDGFAQKLLVARCGVCHGAPTAVSDYPDLVSPGVRDRLLVQRSRACNDKPLVTIDNGYVRGHLFDKLLGPVPGCGNQMPFGALAVLSAPEVECLQAWLRPGDRP